MLYTVEVVALRPSIGDYGRVAAGQRLTCDSQTAKDLISRGLAARSARPRVIYQTKVVLPATEPGAPFHQLHYAHDPNEGRILDRRDTGVAKTDVPQPGTANPARRRRVRASHDS